MIKFLESKLSKFLSALVFQSVRAQPFLCSSVFGEVSLSSHQDMLSHYVVVKMQAIMMAMFPLGVYSKLGK